MNVAIFAWGFALDCKPGLVVRVTFDHEIEHRELVVLHLLPGKFDAWIGWTPYSVAMIIFVFA